MSVYNKLTDNVVDRLPQMSLHIVKFTLAPRRLCVLFFITKRFHRSARALHFHRLCLRNKLGCVVIEHGDNASEVYNSLLHHVFMQLYLSGGNALKFYISHARTMHNYYSLSCRQTKEDEQHFPADFFLSVGHIRCIIPFGVPNHGEESN